MPTPVDSAAPKHRFLGLLLALWSLLLVPPALRSWWPALTPALTALAFGLLMARTLAFDSRVGHATRLSMGVLVIATAVVQFAENLGEAWLVAVLSLELVVVALVTAEMLRTLFADHIDDADRLYAACCGYLLLGLAFAVAYRLVEQLSPGSIPGLVDGHHDRGESSIYFSMVTLSTLGYGDMSPVSPFARALCVSEALVGQLYLAIILARLVANYTRKAR